MDPQDESQSSAGNSPAQTGRQTVNEAGKILDALATLSVDLSCHCDVPPHTLVLPAGKVLEVCSAIDEAVMSLKRILTAAVASGMGPVPVAQLRDLGGSGSD